MYIKKRINDKYSKDSEVGKFKIASVSPPGLVGGRQFTLSDKHQWINESMVIGLTQSNS